MMMMMQARAMNWGYVKGNVTRHIAWNLIQVRTHEYLIIPSCHLFFLAFLLFFLFASSLGLKQAGGKHGCVSLFRCSPRSPVLQSDTGDSINIFARLCPFHPMHAVSSVHTISMYDTPSPQYTITIYRRILLDI